MREFICKECEKTRREDHKYCPNCGSKNSIVKRESLIEDVEDNLPFIFPCYMNLDKEHIYRSLIKNLFGEDRVPVGYIVGIQSKDIVSPKNTCKTSEFPSIEEDNKKGIKVFYVLDSNMDIRGPFFDKKEAKKVK